MSEHVDSGSPRPVSDLLLERYALGELPDDLRRDLERRIANDAELRARLETLRASSAMLLEQHPAASVVRALENRHRVERAEAEFNASTPARARRGMFSSAWTRPLLTGALLLAVIAMPVREFLHAGRDGHVVTETKSPQVAQQPSGPAAGAGHGRPDGAAAPAPIPTPAAPTPPPRASKPAADETRLKGLDPGLALFRRTPQGAEALKPGATVYPGDELRIGYRSGGFPYGAIYSVDGNGSVTRHWPPSGDSAGRLESGEPLLPNAFRLDAAPEFERFYLLVSKTPFPLHAVPESLHAGRPPERDDVRAVRFEVRKHLKEHGI